MIVQTTTEQYNMIDPLLSDEATRVSVQFPMASLAIGKNEDRLLFNIWI
jgi:hypothetical protein